MAPVPGSFALERRCHATERHLIASGKLQANRHLFLAEAAGHGHGRMTGQIERCRVTLQLADPLRLVAERADVGECEWRKRLHRNEQGVDGPEQMREASA